MDMILTHLVWLEKVLYYGTKAKRRANVVIQKDNKGLAKYTISCSLFTISTRQKASWNFYIDLRYFLTNSMYRKSDSQTQKEQIRYLVEIHIHAATELTMQRQIFGEGKISRHFIGHFIIYAFFQRLEMWRRVHSNTLNQYARNVNFSSK